MYEELKARLRDLISDNNWAGNHIAVPSLEAIKQLERQLAERDAEIAKYRDAPVVAWKISFKSPDTPDGFLIVHYHGTNAIADYRLIDPNAVCEHLIVKPGE